MGKIFGEFIKDLNGEDGDILYPNPKETKLMTIKRPEKQVLPEYDSDSRGQGNCDDDYDYVALAEELRLAANPWDGICSPT